MHFWYLIHVERQKETVTVYVLTSQMTPWKTIRTTLVSLFADNLAGAMDFLILPDKDNIRTVSLDIRLVCIRCYIHYIVNKRNDTRVQYFLQRKQF
jgi:hypothetical protein